MPTCESSFNPPMPGPWPARVHDEVGPQGIIDPDALGGKDPDQGIIDWPLQHAAVHDHLVIVNEHRGFPGRSCSRYWLPRRRIVSQNRCDRWAASVRYDDQSCQVCHGDTGTLEVTFPASGPGNRSANRVSASRSRFEYSRVTLLVSWPSSAASWKQAFIGIPP